MGAVAVRAVAGQLEFADFETENGDEALNHVRARDVLVRHKEGILSFQQRVGELGREDLSIVLIHDATELGRKLLTANLDRTRPPYAYGLFPRKPLQEGWGAYAKKLREVQGTPVLVVDQGVKSEVFDLRKPVDWRDHSHAFDGPTAVLRFEPYELEVHARVRIPYSDAYFIISRDGIEEPLTDECFEKAHATKPIDDLKRVAVWAAIRWFADQHRDGLLSREEMKVAHDLLNHFTYR